jgi:hypothetical protein
LLFNGGCANVRVCAEAVASLVTRAGPALVILITCWASDSLARELQHAASWPSGAIPTVVRRKGNGKVDGEVSVKIVLQSLDPVVRELAQRNAENPSEFSADSLRIPGLSTPINCVRPPPSTR